MAMGTFPFQWPMDPASSTGLDASFLPSLLPPPPAPAAGSDDSVAYYGAPQMHAASLPDLAPHFPSRDAAAELAMRRAEEEVAGIRLVHLLMSCAGAIEAGDHALASAQLADANASLAALSTASGIGRVAVHFTDALSRRLFFSPTSAPQPPAGTDAAFLYHHFYEACPYLKFAHFTANQAILEAFHGCDAVHVVDFSIMQGLQWPALIQALALRPGGPPFLRITGIGPPSPPGRDDLRDVGLRLADLARSVRVRFSFRGVAANTLDEVQPWMLQVAPGEAVAVNSVLQLHRLLADPDDHNHHTHHAPIDAVLDCVASLHPKILTVVEQEADHNKPGFLDRFTEALFYYSAVFDSLDASGTASPMAEAYLQREICDIVCNDGGARAERHEPLSRWRDRLARAGLSAVPLGPSALRQARMLVGLSSGEGHSVEEADGCLTLGWHGRPLFSASAWQASPAVAVDAEEDNPHNSNTSNVSSSGGDGGGDSNNSAGSSSNGKSRSSGVVGAAGNMFL
ncbi:protein SLENDER RICE1-LIKE 1 [Lolium perenne]|uniref:protein SLENDER RICE1-LIKE 1 n=1 Tax=Lolium perenne TaxID=4522 RepID=UPI0021EB1140|nr:protein SLENDER RICE1-LIKE 1-like [Lolium perenne]